MAEKSDSSKMIILKCPQCGGQLDLDPDKEVATCPFCKTKLLIVRSIEQNNVINYNIRIDNTGKKEQDPSSKEDYGEQLRIKIRRLLPRAAAAAAVIIALGLIFKACGAVIGALSGSGGGNETGEEVVQDADSETGTENGQDSQEASSEGRVIEVPPYDAEVPEIDPIPQKTESIAAAEIKEFPVHFTERGQEVRFDVTVPNPGSVYVYIAEMRSDEGAEIQIYDEKGERKGGLGWGRNGSGVVFKTAGPGEKYSIHVIQSEGLSEFVVRVGMPKPVTDLSDITVLSDRMDYKNQENVYTITAGETGMYSFFPSEMMADMRIGMVLYDRLGARVTSNSYAYTGRGIWAELTAGETYTLAVSQSEEIGSYDLLVGRQKTAVDMEEYVHVKDRSEFAYQRNCYTFTARADGNCRIEMTEVNTDDSFEISMYDRLGQNIGTFGTYNRSNTGRTFAGLKAGETYRVYVGQSEGLGTYILSVYQPKDIVEITEGDTIRDSIEVADQSNTYSFTSSRTGDVTLTISGLTGGSVVALKVYNDLGENLYTDSYFVNGDSLTIHGTKPGFHAVICIEAAERSSGYVLTLE